MTLTLTLLELGIALVASIPGQEGAHAMGLGIPLGGGLGQS